MTDPDDCPCLPSAESGTCPHTARGLWAEFDQTPATPEPTPGADPFALLAACGDHILDLLIASAAEHPQMPAQFIHLVLPEAVARHALAVAVQRLEPR